MRRAEKAGRESADNWIGYHVKFPWDRERITRHLAQSDPPHKIWNPSKEEIGAHQLTGRAYAAALEAYDRGYRARIMEALEALK